MWQWIVDHPGSTKQEWCITHPKLLTKEIEDHCDCYACKEDFERGGDSCSECFNCPVNWGNGDCLDDDSPYADWEEDEEHKQSDAVRVLNIIKETWV